MTGAPVGMWTWGRVQGGDRDPEIPKIPGNTEVRDPEIPKF